MKKLTILLIMLICATPVFFAQIGTTLVLRMQTIAYYKKQADIYYDKFRIIDSITIAKLKELGINYDPTNGSCSYISTDADTYSNKYDFSSNNIAEPKSHSQFDLDRDTKIVNSYIAQGDSHAATKYLHKLFENDQYPEDANELFGYACLVENLTMQIQKRSVQSSSIMDIMSSFDTFTDQQTADKMLTTLLFLAANKGHRGAYQLLQLKTAMHSGESANLPQSNPGRSSNSIVGKKTCSFCHGKGWIEGSHTPTYGNTGTYWCGTCGSEVPHSHSHNKCPSCNGTGYVPTIY